MSAKIISTFTENKKYHSWYFAIIDRARERKLDGYRERHHIIPRSFGGSDEKTNLVDLTFREHFICHWLLTQMTEGDVRTRALRALNYMCNGSGVWKKKGTNYREGRGIISSWRYDVARRAARDAQIGSKRPGLHSIESRARIGASLKGNKNKAGKKQKQTPAQFLARHSWTDDMRAEVAARMKGNNYGKVLKGRKRPDISARLKDRKQTPEQIAANKASWTDERRAAVSARFKGKKRPDVSAALKGIVRSVEYREKQRIAQTGKTLSPETRQKLSAARKGKKLSAETYTKIYTKEHRAKLAALIAERNRTHHQTKGLKNG